MKKELPKVFANKINKEIKNNEKIYISQQKTNSVSEDKNQKETKKKKEKNINQIIDEIMNTHNYIYKIPVKIKTPEKEITTKIIGKNKKNIITIDNELIKIEEIIDIEMNEDK